MFPLLTLSFHQGYIFSKKNEKWGSEGKEGKRGKKKEEGKRGKEKEAVLFLIPHNHRIFREKNSIVVGKEEKDCWGKNEVWGKWKKEKKDEWVYTVAYSGG